MQFVKLKSQALATFELPNEVQLSGTPLSGRFKIQCIDENGQTSTTGELKPQDNWYWNVVLIMQSCFGLQDKLIPLRASDLPTYYQDGIKIKFRFSGLNADPGQFKIIDSDVSPLKGDDIVITDETIVPYGTNLFYDPVPFEFLRTYEEKPQVIVSVGEQPAVCHNMTCDFTYTKPVGEITSSTYDQATRKLII